MDFVPSSLANPSTIAGSTLTGVTIVASTITGSTISSGNTISPYALSAEQYVSVHRNGVTQAITGTTYVKIQHTTEEFDASSVFDNVTDYRMTPTVSGVYHVVGCAKIVSAAGAGNLISAIYKNGASYKQHHTAVRAVNEDTSAIVSVRVPMNGTTDYLEHYFYQSVGSSETLDGTATQTFFQAMWVSK